MTVFTFSTSNHLKVRNHGLFNSAFICQLNISVFLWEDLILLDKAGSNQLFQIRAHKLATLKSSLDSVQGEPSIVSHTGGQA